MNDSSDHRLRALERTTDRLRSPVLNEGELLDPIGIIQDLAPEEWDSDLKARAARDRLPLPAPDNREGYWRNNHAAYWMMGLKDFDAVRLAASSHGRHGGRAFDFGGSTGRVFRHFHCQQAEFDIWSSDFNVVSYRWNQIHMPADIKVFLNGFVPTLPIPDHHFDIVTAFSVFTHIDDLESPWLLELRRVLKPGGLFYLTIHDEVFWEHMPKSVLAAVRRSDRGAKITSDSPFPAPRAAFEFSSDSYYNTNVFHSHEYVRRQWGRFFDIVKIEPMGAELQCVVVMTT